MLKRIVSILLVAGMIIASTLCVSASEIGYPQAAQGEVLADPQQEVIIQSATYMVIGDGVRFRSAPSLSGTVLGLLYYGDLVNGPHGVDDVYADGHYWKNVYSYKHGTWGWVAADYLVEIG